MTKLVSIVVPLFNEEGNVAGLLARFDRIVEANPGYRFEFVLVDDGSSDDTVALLRAGIAERRDARLIVLSRNFGSHYALTAGLHQARGDAAIIVGADAQEPLDLISTFLERWEDGHEIVWGLRRRRADQGRFSKWLSKRFSALLRKHSELKSFPAEGPSAFLADRVVIDVVNRLTEHNRNVGGLLSWTGFRQDQVFFDQQERVAGTSKWTSQAKVKLAIDSFVEFSFTPIRFVTASGVFIALVGFAYAAFLIARRLFFEVSAPGWTSVVVIVLLIGGLQLIVLGVLGEYIWRGVDEARNRPLFVVREVVDTTAEDSAEAGMPSGTVTR